MSFIREAEASRSIRYNSVSTPAQVGEREAVVPAEVVIVKERPGYAQAQRDDGEKERSQAAALDEACP